jgi:hypothetical protein
MMKSDFENEREPPQHREIQVAPHMKRPTEQLRLIELVAALLARDSGKRPMTRSGRWALVVCEAWNV